jgi:hypothetical protein
MHAMTAKEFKRVKKRDLDNGAVIDELAEALEQREMLLVALKELLSGINDSYRDGIVKQANEAISRAETNQ